MPHVWLDKRVSPPVFRYSFFEWAGPKNLGFKGRKRTGTGVRVANGRTEAEARNETIAMAEIEQSEQNKIKMGWVAPPKQSDLGRMRPYAEIATEYLEWGGAKGGRNGFPWGKKHFEKRKYLLRFWQKALNLHVLADLEGSLPRVDRHLIKLQRTDVKGRPCGPASGKTKNSYAEGLSAFAKWCVERGYLEKNPLDGLARFEATKASKRRALTVEEIRKFLDGLDGPKSTRHSRARRLGYELALASGLRAGELRALKVKHLNKHRGGIQLEAHFTKNRKAGFLPLPKSLVLRLSESAAGKGAEDPLVHVARESSNTLRKDLRRVGMDRWGSGMLEDGSVGHGKVDFHALRVAYTTLLLETGADVKTVQTLARHSTAELSLNVYGRAREDRLQKAAEAIGDAILSKTGLQMEYKQAVGFEQIKESQGVKVVGREGFEPP